jgi:hypothetical protein
MARKRDLRLLRIASQEIAQQFKVGPWARRLEWDAEDGVLFDL